MARAQGHASFKLQAVWVCLSILAFAPVLAEEGYGPLLDNGLDE